MSRFTISVKRVNSLLKFLRGGRGLSEYKGGMRVILQVWAGGDSFREANLVEALPLTGGRSEVTFDIPRRFYGSPIIMFGAEAEPHDLFFKLHTTFSLSKYGDWMLRTPRAPGRLRPIKKLSIAFVDDWTNALLQLQRELEAESQDHERLLRSIRNLRLRLYDKAFWQSFFSDPDGGYRARALSEFVNIDRIDGRVVFRPDRLEVNQILRRPNGSRFGRAKFDYKLVPSRSGAIMAGGWEWITGFDVDPLDVKFSRPGLKALSSSNRDALDEFYQSTYQENDGRALERSFRTEARNITAMWPTLKELASAGRRGALTESLIMYQRRFAHRVRKKVMYPDGRTAWVNVSCLRPRHACAIETVVTDPPLGGLVPPPGRTGRRKK